MRDFADGVGFGCIFGLGREERSRQHESQESGSANFHRGIPLEPATIKVVVVRVRPVVIRELLSVPISSLLSQVSYDNSFFQLQIF